MQCIKVSVRGAPARDDKRQAIKILGCPGSEVSRAKNEAGVRSMMYDWSGPAWSNMDATYQNDFLIAKGWIGLGNWPSGTRRNLADACRGEHGCRWPIVSRPIREAVETHRRAHTDQIPAALAAGMPACYVAQARMGSILGANRARNLRWILSPAK